MENTETIDTVLESNSNFSLKNIIKEVCIAAVPISWFMLVRDKTKDIQEYRDVQLSEKIIVYSAATVLAGLHTAAYGGLAYTLYQTFLK